MKSKPKVSFGLISQHLLPSLPEIVDDDPISEGIIKMEGNIERHSKVKFEDSDTTLSSKPLIASEKVVERKVKSLHKISVVPKKISKPYIPSKKTVKGNVVNGKKRRKERTCVVKIIDITSNKSDKDGDEDSGEKHIHHSHMSIVENSTTGSGEHPDTSYTVLREKKIVAKRSHVEIEKHSVDEEGDQAERGYNTTEEVFPTLYNNAYNDGPYTNEYERMNQYYRNNYYTDRDQNYKNSNTIYYQEKHNTFKDHNRATNNMKHSLFHQYSLNPEANHPTNSFNFQDEDILRSNKKSYIDDSEYCKWKDHPLRPYLYPEALSNDNFKNSKQKQERSSLNIAKRSSHSRHHHCRKKYCSKRRKGNYKNMKECESCYREFMFKPFSCFLSLFRCLFCMDNH